MSITDLATKLMCVALLASAFAVAACGEDDSAEAPPETNEQQITRAFDEVQAAFVRRDGEAYCAALSPHARREVVRFGPTTALRGDCATVVYDLAARSTDTGIRERRAKVLTATVNGARAKATVSDPDGPPAQMRFAKMDGRWRLLSMGFESTLLPSSR